MSQQASDKPYETKNRSKVVFFISEGADWTGKERKRGDHKMTFYYNREDVQELDDLWESGEPILRDVRKVFAAESIFNSAVHDEI